MRFRFILFPVILYLWILHEFCKLLVDKLIHMLHVIYKYQLLVFLFIAKGLDYSFTPYPKIWGQALETSWNCPCLGWVLVVWTHNSDPSNLNTSWFSFWFIVVITKMTMEMNGDIMFLLGINFTRSWFYLFISIRRVIDFHVWFRGKKLFEKLARALAYTIWSPNTCKTSTPKVILYFPIVIILYTVPIICAEQTHVVNFLRNLTCRINISMIRNFCKHRYLTINQNYN
jgi:hypothetical protein